MVKEQKWEYSAPDIHRSHWIEAGFGDDNEEDDYIECMESLLSKMKMSTCKLRNGDGDMIICLGVEFDHDERILLHDDDDVLLPHWKELANSYI